MTFDKDLDRTVDVDEIGPIHIGSAAKLLKHLGVIPVSTAARVGMEVTRHGIVSEPTKPRPVNVVEIRGADAVEGLLESLGGVPNNVLSLF